MGPAVEASGALSQGGEPTTAPISEGPESGGVSRAEQAFFDPVMKYSVMAITYTLTETNVDLAFQAYDFLVAKGFPAVRPMPHKDRIYIFVGAEESTATLGDVLLELRSLKMPPSNRTEFRGAYLVNIASYR